MGFGYGGSQARSGIRRYTNSQLAHVWNAQTESHGQTNNGNAYFDGAALYSYGSHFLTGYIMPDGVALLNGDSYSVTTSGHQSDARGAVSNRATFTIKGLTELAPLLRAITAGNKSDGRKAEARQLIRAHAEALAASHRLEAGESTYYLAEEEDENGSRLRRRETGERESAGAYLTRLAGLPAASWPKLQREAAKTKAKREAEQAKEQRESAISRAKHLADATDSAFREAIRLKLARTYSAEADLKRMALDFFRAKKTAKAEGFSAKRLDSLRRREKRLRSMVAEAESLARLAKARDATAGAIRTFRQGVATLASYAGDANRDSMNAADSVYRSAAILADSPRLPFTLRRRMQIESAEARALFESMRESYEARQAEEREANRKARELETAEHRKAWLAGEAPLAGLRFDAESGGAALRIKGDMLQTSHGAEVPLEHAIRAFRFIKLCREAGREWSANGQQIRVGHFRVDSVSAAGDMVAGCHAFTWPEIERVAKLAGVFNAPADDSAIIRKEVA
jgi:hypothetical protein